MLVCMPEADDWQLEKDYIRQICEDLYNEHLQEVHQYKGTLNAQIYRDAKKNLDAQKMNLNVGGDQRMIMVEKRKLKIIMMT